jgi:hypothetical protein
MMAIADAKARTEAEYALLQATHAVTEEESAWAKVIFDTIAEDHDKDTVCMDELSFLTDPQACY